MRRLYGNYGINHHLGFTIVEEANLNLIDTQCTEYFNRAPSWWIEDDRNITAMALTLATEVDELSAPGNK